MKDENKHGKVAAMPAQFKKGHWEKDVSSVEMVDTRYASEMGACEEYKTMVDKQNQYAKRHKAQH